MDLWISTVYVGTVFMAKKLKYLAYECFVLYTRNYVNLQSVNLYVYDLTDWCDLIDKDKLSFAVILD